MEKKKIGRPKGTGHPLIPAEQRRQEWHGRLAPETLARIRSLSKLLNVSQAAIVDAAIAADPRA